VLRVSSVGCCAHVPVPSRLAIVSFLACPPTDSDASLHFKPENHFCHCPTPFQPRYGNAKRKSRYLLLAPRACLLHVEPCGAHSLCWPSMVCLTPLPFPARSARKSHAISQNLDIESKQFCWGDPCSAALPRCSGCPFACQSEWIYLQNDSKTRHTRKNGMDSKQRSGAVVSWLGSLPKSPWFKSGLRHFMIQIFPDGGSFSQPFRRCSNFTGAGNWQLESKPKLGQDIQGNRVRHPVI